ncbi:HEPN domain-containing protein [Hydrogenispora ethanolica]|uniref:HEPN domain-containing protein n=1 Tax=Hydrogenispora ethanolica TaxID=1082276 RepID=A0A4R1S4T8_HYDET|nr:HEPN domain-containing protein [Hydrogenispora ethanolica]TCL74129.1 HEPN domain-containing protein [Hydrogenispora ethanolica]
MDPLDKYSYWEDIAEYDLKTAEAMLDSGRYLYVVFMCQQAIEKITKGLFVLKSGEEPPRTHNILAIFEKIQFQPDQIMVKVEEYREFLEELLAFYISERYPSYKEKITLSVNHQSAVAILSKAKEVFAWLKSLKI